MIFVKIARTWWQEEILEDLRKKGKTEKINDYNSFYSIAAVKNFLKRLEESNIVFSVKKGTRGGFCAATISVDEENRLKLIEIS